MKYENLTNPKNYCNDEPVDFAAVDKELLPGPIDQEHWVQISERLWTRLLSMGTAYELHFGQAIEPIIDSVLWPEQCDSLSEELEFLKGVVKDQALIEAIDIIQTKLAMVINRGNMRLVISPP